jgi:hypothetical protein
MILMDIEKAKEMSPLLKALGISVRATLTNGLVTGDRLARYQLLATDDIFGEYIAPFPLPRFPGSCTILISTNEKAS